MNNTFIKTEDGTLLNLSHIVRVYTIGDLHWVETSTKRSYTISDADLQKLENLSI